MNAIDFKQANVTYVADGCNNLKVFRTIDTNYNCPSLISCWEPTDEELEYIKQCINNNKKPKIYLDILSHSQPPVWVGCNLCEEE